MRSYSPLRYPGGKGALSPFLIEVIYANNVQGGEYVEPYAGGAAAALALLFGEHVDRILINDADYRVYSIWKSILTHPSRFANEILSVPLTVEEWHKQKAIYKQPKQHSCFKVGFAAFFLNRCNRSGIIMNAGPIGGMDQTGNYKIDARFNREDLAGRIQQIFENRSRISVENKDALQLLSDLKTRPDQKRLLVYLDPPYFVQGSRLYLNAYGPSDHATVSDFLKSGVEFPWLMTYDNVPEIKALYPWATCRDFVLKYSAYESREGGEVLIAPRSLKLPELVGSARVV
jgi:DNA adenine methylase